MRRRRSSVGLQRSQGTYRPGEVETDSETLPRAALLRCDYYNCLKPRDMHAVMRITLAAENVFRKCISMMRRPRSGTSRRPMSRSAAA